MRAPTDTAVVLGAGLSGLAAGHALSHAGVGVEVLERERTVGGLARTVVEGPYRWDLGGHRFFTRDARVDALVRGLLGPEALTVRRRSRILLGGRAIEYPLRTWNALSSVGARTAWRVVAERAARWGRGRRAEAPPVSLEDFVVQRFGRTLFERFFEEYSEKVWGIPCDRISADWAAQRIGALSLPAAIRNAVSGHGRATVRTLTDAFLYPADGIGVLSERLRDALVRAGGPGRAGGVRCGAAVTAIRHDGLEVRAVVADEAGRAAAHEAGAFVSTLPLPELVGMLEPRPPLDVLAAAARLRFRDLVVVAVRLDVPRATDQSWIYCPERAIPFGRLHEPTNWSARMAPGGRTLLVAERFCFRGDPTWMADDASLVDETVRALERLRIASPARVLGGTVTRVAKAYPLFEVGYAEDRWIVCRWLAGLRNLVLAGRGGTFAYHNMDHAIASGLAAADRIVASAGVAEARDGARERRSA